MKTTQIYIEYIIAGAVLGIAIFFLALGLIQLFSFDFQSKMVDPTIINVLKSTKKYILDLTKNENWVIPSALFGFSAILGIIAVTFGFREGSKDYAINKILYKIFGIVSEGDSNRELLLRVILKDHCKQNYLHGQPKFIPFNLLFGALILIQSFSYSTNFVIPKQIMDYCSPNYCLPFLFQILIIFIIFIFVLARTYKIDYKLRDNNRVKDDVYLSNIRRWCIKPEYTSFYSHYLMDKNCEYYDLRAILHSSDEDVFIDEFNSRWMQARMAGILIFPLMLLSLSYSVFLGYLFLDSEAYKIFSIGNKLGLGSIVLNLLLFSAFFVMQIVYKNRLYYMVGLLVDQLKNSETTAIGGTKLEGNKTKLDEISKLEFNPRISLDDLVDHYSNPLIQNLFNIQIANPDKFEELLDSIWNDETIKNQCEKIELIERTLKSNDKFIINDDLDIESIIEEIHQIKKRKQRNDKLYWGWYIFLFPIVLNLIKLVFKMIDKKIFQQSNYEIEIIKKYWVLQKLWVDTREVNISEFDVKNYEKLTDDQRNRRDKELHLSLWTATLFVGFAVMGRVNLDQGIRWLIAILGSILIILVMMVIYRYLVETHQLYYKGLVWQDSELKILNKKSKGDFNPERIPEEVTRLLNGPKCSWGTYMYRFLTCVSGILCIAFLFSYANSDSKNEKEIIINNPHHLSATYQSPTPVHLVLDDRAEDELTEKQNNEKEINHPTP